MSYMQEAYEALVTRLKDQIKEEQEGHQHDMDQQIAHDLIVQKVLMNFIVKQHGINILLNLARDIDEQIANDKHHPCKKFGMEEYVEIEYESSEEKA